jgi:probable F420-dependent oxidoreductase
MTGPGDTACVTAAPATARIRFGIQAVAGDSRSSFVELARRAEGVGFDTLLVPDHVGLSDPFVTLQAAADATTTLRVGTYVLNNDFHDPVLLARAAATLDVLSDGRFELGLGAGHAQPEYEARGVAFDPARTRVARLAEAVPLLRRLLDGETVTFAGAYYRLRDAGCAPHPRQARLPIVVGGNGATVLRLAAREADGAGLTGLGRTLPDGDRHEADWSAASLEGRLQTIKNAAGSRGPLELSALVQVVAVTDDRADAARRVAERVPGLTEADALATPFLLLGSVPQMVEQILAAHQRWGLSYFVTRADSVDVMADVIAGARAEGDIERR